MEKTTRTAVNPELLNELLQELTAAAKRLALYPPGHPACKVAANKPYLTLEQIWSINPELVLSLAGGKLVANGIPLDDRWVSDGLGKVMAESGVQSLSIARKLSRENFEKFIAFLNTRESDRDFVAFIESNQIEGIAVDKWHYELIGDDEQVVSADLVGAQAEEIHEFRDAFLDAIKDQPELLVELFSNRSDASSGAGGLGGDGSGQSTGGGTGAGSGGGDGFPDAPGGVKVPQLDSAMQELNSLSDDQLLKMLVSGLQRAIEGETTESEISVSRSLFALKEIVERRHDPALLSKLKQLLEESQLVSQKQVDLILREKASPESLARIEAEHVLEHFVRGEHDPDAVGSMFHWLRLVEDKSVSAEIYKSFFEDAQELDFDLNSDQISFAIQLSDAAAKSIRDVASISFVEEILARLDNPKISRDELALLAVQIKPLFLAAVNERQCDLAGRLTSAITRIIDGKGRIPDEVVDLAINLKQELCSAEVASGLIATLAADFARYNKQITPMLEQFCGAAAVSAFADEITHEDRGVRMLMIRLLSRMGEDTLDLLRERLASLERTSESGEARTLPQERWFELRNFVLVVGNIKSPKSVALLRTLTQLPDERIAAVVLEALETIAGDDAAELVVEILDHPSREVQRKALQVLSRIGSATQWEGLRDYMLKNVSEYANCLPLLISLDRERSETFLIEVIDGKSQSLHKLFDRPDDSLNELIVDTFIRWRSERTDWCLKRYAEGASKSLLGHFRKPASAKLAERYLKSRHN